MPVEFRCRDCGQVVVSYAGEADPIRCSGCEWVTDYIPPEQRAAARERLGVARDADTPWLRQERSP